MRNRKILKGIVLILIIASTITLVIYLAAIKAVNSLSFTPDGEMKSLEKGGVSDIFFSLEFWKRVLEGDFKNAFNLGFDDMIIVDPNDGNKYLLDGVAMLRLTKDSYSASSNLENFSLYYDSFRSVRNNVTATKITLFIETFAFILLLLLAARICIYLISKRKRKQRAIVVSLISIALLMGCSNVPSEHEEKDALEKWISLSDEAKCISIVSFKKIGGNVKTVDTLSLFFTKGSRYEHYHLNFVAEIKFNNDCCFDSITFLTTPAYSVHDDLSCIGFKDVGLPPTGELVEITDMKKTIKDLLVTELISRGYRNLRTFKKSQIIKVEGTLTFNNKGFRGRNTKNHYD